MCVKMVDTPQRLMQCLSSTPEIKAESLHFKFVLIL